MNQTEKLGINMIGVESGSFKMGAINKIPESKPIHNHSLRGRVYNTVDLARPKGYMELCSMDVKKWEWKGKPWGTSVKGYMTSPVSEKVTFTAKADRGFRLYIGGERVIDVWCPDFKTKELERSGIEIRKGSFELEKGKKYPVVIELYVNESNAAFNLQWEWEGHGPEIVPMEIFEPMPKEANQRTITELGGSFVAPYGNYDEKPVHKVNITNKFKISDYPITAEQYRKFDSEYVGDGFATGISWYDAMDFCKWLSEKEGKTYRLPTEAEWEYACRAGSETWFGTGDEKPDENTPNNWGIKSMNAGPPEWVYDWYGPYPAEEVTDPIGPENGFVKVVRGGALHDGHPKIGAFEGGIEEIPGIDFDAPFFYRSASRAAVEPGFPPKPADKKSFGKVLTGELFKDTMLKKKLRNFYIAYMSDDLTEKTDYHGGLGELWSFRVTGNFTSPVTEEVYFHATAHEGIRLYINDNLVIDGWGQHKGREGSYNLVKGQKYKMTIEMYEAHDRGSYKLEWYWNGKNESLIPMDIFDEVEIPPFELITPIGFRIVEGELPNSKHSSYLKPFAHSAIKQNCDIATASYNKEKPYFKMRPIMPVPPEDLEIEYIEACGLEGLGNHNEAPALAVCANGDILAIYYSAYMRWAEYYPDTPMIVTRLRYGTDEWSIPELVYNQADIVGGAALLWNDNGTIRWFTGAVGLHRAPFRFTASKDNGETWEEVKLPRLRGHIKGYSPQPISTAFRDEEGIWYMPSDGAKKQNCGVGSLLWATDDEGETWYDTGGRSFSRHTPYVIRKDGAFYSQGGKNLHYDGYQATSTSYDKGKTWIKGKTEFPMLWTKQKASFIRLKSGRLFFAADAHKSGDGWKPHTFPFKGVYVALSEDEGKTWHIKELEMAQLYEKKVYNEYMDREEPCPDWNSLKTIGYSVATQGDNEIIHIATTSNHPAMHFEMNEAWILSDAQEIEFEEEIPTSLENFEEYFDNGKLKNRWSGFIAKDGRFLRHGKEINYFDNGNKEYEGEYDNGFLVGEEKFWSKDGKLRWEKKHCKDDNSYVWKQYWSNGKLKAESTWKNHKCEGIARTWDTEGRLLREVEFNEGHPIIKEWPLKLYYGNLE